VINTEREDLAPPVKEIIRGLFGIVCSGFCVPCYRADEVINSEREDLAARVKEITGGKGADAAVDPVGGALTGQVSRVLGLGSGS
jgi:hypothetical protein